MSGDKELNSSIKDGNHCNFGTDESTDKSQEKETVKSCNARIDQALDQSVKELEMLEKFYQQRGKTDRAGEISLTLRRMRSRNDSKTGADPRQDGH